MLTIPKEFKCQMEKVRCICFTATSSDNNMDSVENDVFNFLGYKDLSYWPSCV